MRILESSLLDLEEDQDDNGGVERSSQTGDNWKVTGLASGMDVQ